ncbi:hypothetical protein CEUSTIGMA_g10867.t1 [Chlamydomonas eustigma]|uniref:Uncharacterized protein n=1 Tax=Chlamydomonas eustigma TaxID=1157962 RepID=A0A250XKJ2_9CHLO|nr:hypothetical protein CEUSTIGMA_g10867.t1 [Chlamydomonas eustigma]|eukprot:GAX83442.1 hypothetical protein CEUSTIGMA_g10867.t1 [Chlamydomonas eustigma]
MSVKLQRNNSHSDLQSQLESLRLKVSSDTAEQISKVLESLADIISTRINAIISDGIDSEEEAKMWSCFAEVYQREIEEYRKKGKSVNMSMKQQIFADILVWAEVSRPGYDKLAAEFVTGPHIHDESFQRIGQALAEAKSSRNVTKL